MSGSVPAQKQTLSDLGKSVSDLISPDTSIDFLGAVTGTLKYINEWEAFSSNKGEQSGHFFPVHIDDKYKGKEITCKGLTTKTANDLDWVLLVKDKDSTFTFECEGNEILNLSFKDATFAQNTIAVKQAVKRSARKTK